RVRVPKAAELVALELQRQIVVGELQEGDPLPGELDLMAEYGVSRPTLREALRILESQNLLSVRRGARGGARAHLPNVALAAQYAAILLQIESTTLADVLNARLLLEVALVRKGAESRTELQLRALRDAWNAEEEILEQPSVVATPYFERFHRLVLECSGSL